MARQFSTWGMSEWSQSVHSHDLTGQRISGLRLDSAVLDNASTVGGIDGTTIASWGQYQAYTPTLGGTGWALGDGTIAAEYARVGNLIDYRCLITWGSTSTFGSGGLTITYPVQASATYIGNHLVYFRDQTGPTLYLGAWSPNSPTLFIPRVLGTAGVLSNVTTNNPFTWASTDLLFVAGTYEAA